MAVVSPIGYEARYAARDGTDIRETGDLRRAAGAGERCGPARAAVVQREIGDRPQFGFANWGLSPMALT